MDINEKKIAVAMSGGVDSAVAALLLQKEGYDLLGLTMRLWSETEQLEDDPCPALDSNARDAAAVAELLGFPHRTVSFGSQFRRCVVEPFLHSYKRGETPNPCVDCNKHIKFGALHRAAVENGCTFLATGHYVRWEQDESGHVWLKKAADTNKDQSYFLWGLPADLLPHLRFPLGGMTKPEIREIAKQNGIPAASRSDSQDICFIPNGDYVSFIEQHDGGVYPPGDFIAADGRILGRHNGLIRYTVGQRKGLGIALGAPAFVAKKNAADNTVTLTSDAELYSAKLTAREANFFADIPLDTPTRAQVKIRYRHTPALATVVRTEDNRFSVCFDEPQRAIAPGQSAVIYDGDTVLGGGIID